MSITIDTVLSAVAAIAIVSFCFWKPNFPQNILSKIGVHGGGGIDSHAETTKKVLSVYDIGKNPITKAKLQINGHDRFSERRAVYFNQVTPALAGHRVPSKHIYVYSFALKPEEHQPSGTCNFSRI